MDFQDKTREELIIELQELKLAYHSLKVSAEADIIAQKQTMEALQASEERFQLLFNKAPLGYQSLDFDGNFIEVNQQWLDALGYNREEVIGKWFGDFLTPTYQDGFRKRFPIFKAQGHIHSEFEMVHKNGSVLFIAFDGRIGYDTKGNFKQTHCILQDITQVKMAEKALLKSHELLNTMEKAAKIGGWEFDVETMVQTWTEETFHILEIDTTHGAPIVPEGIGFIVPEYQPMALLGIQRAIEFGEPYNQEWEVITAKGNKRWVNAIATPYQENGKTKSVSGSFQDITKRKLAEIALVLSEENLSITLHSIGDGVISTDKNGLVIQMNPVAETLCGWTLTEALGKPLAEVFTIINTETRQAVADPVAKVFENGEIVGLANHTVLVSRNGTEYQIADSAAPIKNKAGEITGVVLVFSDITASYIAQKQIKDSEKQYRLLFQNLTAGFALHEIILNAEGKPCDYRFLDVNPAFETLTGLKAIDLIGKTVMEVLPNTEPYWIETYGEVALKGNTISFENYHRELNKHYQVSAYSPEPGKFATVILDITGRKQSELLLQDKTEEIEAQNEEYQQINEELNQTNQELAEARKNAEINEARIKMALEVSKSGAWDWDILKNTFYWSDEFLLLFGLPANTIPGFEAWTKALHPDDIERASTKIQEAIENRTELLNDYRIILPNKEIRWIRSTGHTTYLNNKPARMIGLCMDITWQKTAEQELLKSEERYALVIDASEQGIWDWNVETNEIFYSEQWKNQIGYEDHELKNEFNTWVEHLHPDEKESCQNALSEYLSQPNEHAIFDFRFRHKDGTYRWIHNKAASIKNKDGKVIRMFGAHTDITERKQAEQALKNRENLLNKVFDLLPIGLWFADENGRLIRGNPAGVKIWGAEPTISIEEYGIFKARRLPSGKEIEPNDWALAHTIREKVTIMDELLEIDSFDGHKKIILNYTAPVMDDQGIIQGAIVVNQDITERKQNEEKLIKSEERFTLVIEALEQGIWDWNVETNDVFYSEQWKRQIGYEDHELKNDFNTWVEHLHPDEREYCQNAVLSYLNQPIEHFILDFRFRHKDGTYRWIHNKAASLKNNEGKVIRLFGSHTDITESKLSEATFKDIIEKNPMSIQILDMEGYSTQVNSAHTKLFGVKIPSDYTILKDPQLLSLGFGDLFEQIKKGEVVYFPDSYYNVHDVDPSFPDSPAWVKAIGFTLNDNNGNPYKIVLMHEDITVRKNAEALLNDIIENNPLSIQVVDNEGYTLRGNPAFIELFGSIPPPEFSIFDDLKSKSPELENLVSKVKNGGIVHLPDIYFNAHDAIAEAPDLPRWIRALIFPLKDSIGESRRFVFMHENITDRKIAEQELIVAKEHAEESDRLKSAFLANMSHEIRTPMNGILGFAELLKEADLTNEQQQEYIRIIGKSGTRMLNIINDIVDISKIEAGLMKVDLKDSNINEKIEFIYTFFKPQAEEKGMQLFFKNTLTAKEATIRTDNEKVYSILTNLVKNAIKYSNEGAIEFGYLKKGEILEFYVKDTGIGIPKNRQSAIFERFVQADITDKMARQGAGLGLSISKAYVEMLGGKIWVESEEGIGSTFYFTLPYNVVPIEKKVVGKVVQAQDENNQINPEVSGLKILIAEDDETSEMLIAIDVAKFGKEILKAGNGYEAVEVCRNNPDIDLILMDILMPAMNGYEATRKIRQFNKDVVIIAQTAFGLSGDREKAIEAGCNDYISKPIKKAELLSLLQKYFKK